MSLSGPLFAALCPLCEPEAEFAPTSSDTVHAKHGQLLTKAFHAVRSETETVTLASVLFKDPSYLNCVAYQHAEVLIVHCVWSEDSLRLDLEL